MEQIESPPTNILDQLVSYQSKQTIRYMDTLKLEIKEQTQLNQALQNNESDENIKYVNSFMQRNQGEIEHQLDELEELALQLTSLVNENQELEQVNDQYKELLDSEECKNLATKLRQIKKLKKDMSHFLELRGIHID